jgi:TPP-dependent pyruvate/acetoin dehydrogenase alpha subunit
MTTRKSKLAAESTSATSFSLISHGKLRALYSAMLQCQMLERRVRRLAAGKHLKDVRTGVGEAVAAGIVLDLFHGDTICAPSGDLATPLLKGVPLRALLSTVASSHHRGSPALSADFVDVNALPFSEIFADQLELTIRAARVSAKKKKIAVLFLNSKETATAEWEQFLCAAAAERLPVLFVCHSGRRKTDLVRQAHRCGLPGITVDEEDVVAIYRVASEAITHARRGNGATLIECKRWTVRGQVRGRDAVHNMETYLMGKGLFSPAFKAKIGAFFERELDAAAANARGTRK